MVSEARNLFYRFFLHIGIFATLEGTKSRHESIVGRSKAVNTLPARNRTQTHTDTFWLRVIHWTHDVVKRSDLYSHLDTDHLLLCFRPALCPSLPKALQNRPWARQGESQRQREPCSIPLGKHWCLRVGTAGEAPWQGLGLSQTWCSARASSRPADVSLVSVLVSWSRPSLRSHLSCTPCERICFGLRYTEFSDKFPVIS